MSHYKVLLVIFGKDIGITCEQIELETDEQSKELAKNMDKIAELIKEHDVPISLIRIPLYGVLK